MDLFDKNEYLTEDAKADLEYSKSNNFLESAIKFVLKAPFKAVSSIYGIIKRILLDKLFPDKAPPAANIDNKTPFLPEGKSPTRLAALG